MQLTNKAEITIQILPNGGGYIFTGVTLGPDGPDGQPQMVDAMRVARENSKDVVEDLKTYMAKCSTLVS